MSVSVLVGTWRLISGEVLDDAGSVAIEMTDGMLHYAPSGHMCAQLVVSARAPGSKLHRAVGDFIAYFGTYSVSEELHTVTHRIEGGYGCYSPGRTLVRSYEIEDDVLFLRASLAEQSSVPLGTTGIAVWERAA